MIIPTVREWRGSSVGEYLKQKESLRVGVFAPKQAEKQGVDFGGDSAELEPLIEGDTEVVITDLWLTQILALWKQSKME